MAALVLKAGPVALARIREQGLVPDLFSHVAGAAGGPKWLALNQLDRLLFGEWLASPARPLTGIGSSIGAWRLAALAQADPVAAINRFEAAYLAQSYSEKPTAREVAEEAGRILEAFVDDRARAEILASERIRLNVVTTLAHGLLGAEGGAAQVLGLVKIIAANALSRELFARCVQRVLFHVPDAAAAYAADGFATHHAGLDADNLRAVLLGTAAIPLVIAPVKNIPGGPVGTYLDGGLIDYHMDLPLTDAPDRPRGLLLLPHFSERVITGWFDRYFRRRVPQNLSHSLLLAPSPELLARLPNGKVPDRRDFALYGRDNAARVRDWKIAIAECGRMADDWQRWQADGSLVDRIQPLDQPRR